MNNLTEELMNRTVPSVSYQGWELIAIDEEENDGGFYTTRLSVYYY